MADDFELSDVLPGSSEPIHEAWLSNEGHSAIAGANAHVAPTL
jgi:hypothetical protein